MAVEMQPNFILHQKFEKLKFVDYVSTDSMSSPSTPSTPNSPPTDPYEIETIKAEDREEVLEFLRQYFISDEPLNVAIKLIGEERQRCPALENFSVKDYDNGLNLKATSNDKIIGVCLNGILKRGYIENMEETHCSDQKFHKILRLLDHVAKESDIFAKFPDIDKIMTVKILSVNTHWRGRGIAKDLMNKTREMARELGCKLMSVDCTSHFTARAIKKLGFHCIYELKYQDYKVDGKVVFEPAQPHNAVTVYVQRLDTAA